MLKLGGAASFTNEAIDFLPAREPARSQHLDGDDSTQLGIAGAKT